ncbi:hypothetical protein F0L68_25325 [Solihabitans fulvus]|uniref:Acyl carrier protein n=1 Tax=Solihabitans fulvus TaxID=1892852 RepID=A0A5B2X2A4_9PSEU|nr:hypothetical protein [Solihabitans fulvus]KAA2257282.1 hypothetical protein F0L68_25325 [Solihabitans fulvus]
MTAQPLPRREDVLAILAGYGDRDARDVGEQLDSLELTWLVAQFERRYAVELDFSDETFAKMLTVDGAVEMLRAAIGTTEGAHG